MIINKINVEGVCTKDELVQISTKNSIIINKSINIKVYQEAGIKDIMEISLEVNIVELKILEFKDKKIGTITISTELNIIAVENNRGNTLFVENEKIYFNHTFDLKTKIKNKEYLYIKVIDCYFKVENNNYILGTLTYLIKEKEDEILVDNKLEKDIKQYRLIDVCQEFA